ncbi:lipopolysaccharide biosynthesis protein [Alteribacillus sp. JSM 102045]|uniref:lipopolysaccharide biosynthesis protein n=1 Tax=Alteribacillus sp. JSM 102045 TaxID=1562101 RepID=UPI0035C1E04F
MENNLKNKAISGVKWTSLNTLFTTFTSPVYQIVLAFLLEPQEFGYIAVISLFIGLSILLSDVGIGESIIQRDNVTSTQISSLFYFNLILTSAIACIIYILAPYIQNFYNLQNLESIIRLLVITVIFNSMSSVFRVYIQKKMLFRNLSIIQISKTSIDILASSLLIWLGYGIIGYVYGTIIASTFNTILLILIAFNRTDLRILFYFNIKEVMPFLNFGISISLKKILTFVSQRLDEIIIGGSLSSDVLGVYYFGKRLILQLQTVMTNSFSRVLLPIFSRLKKDLSNLKNAYMKITYMSAMVGFPIFVGLALTSHLIIPVFFGDDWSGSIEVIRILSFAMLFQVLTANIATSMLYSVNRPNSVLMIDIFTNVIYFISLLLFSYMGLTIILILYALYTITKAVILQFYVGKELKYSIIEYFQMFKKIIFSNISMTLIIVILSFLLSGINELIQLIITVMIGVFVYITIQWINDRGNMVFLITTIKKKSKSD